MVDELVLHFIHNTAVWMLFIQSFCGNELVVMLGDDLWHIMTRRPLTKQLMNDYSDTHQPLLWCSPHEDVYRGVIAPHAKGLMVSVSKPLKKPFRRRLRDLAVIEQVCSHLCPWDLEIKPGAGNDRLRMQSILNKTQRVSLVNPYIVTMLEELFYENIYWSFS